MKLAILKKCPFCGGAALLFPYDPYDGYQGDCTSYIVKCIKCGAKIKARTESKAIELWNNRVK